MTIFIQTSICFELKVRKDLLCKQSIYFESTVLCTKSICFEMKVCKDLFIWKIVLLWVGVSWCEDVLLHLVRKLLLFFTRARSNHYTLSTQSIWTFYKKMLLAFNSEQIDFLYKTSVCFDLKECNYFCIRTSICSELKLQLFYIINPSTFSCFLYKIYLLWVESV